MGQGGDSDCGLSTHMCTDARVALGRLSSSRVVPMRACGRPGTWPQRFCANRPRLLVPWAECLRDIRANCLHRHNWGRAGAVPTTVCFVSPHNSDRQLHGEHSQVDSSHAGALRSSSSSRGAPVPSTYSSVQKQNWVISCNNRPSLVA